MLLAIGHLEEAAQESEEQYPELSQRLLGERRNLEEDPEYDPGLIDILVDVWAALEDDREQDDEESEGGTSPGNENQ